MKKRILYLTYFYEPDLSAGSFRNTALAGALSKELGEAGDIFLFTSQPNRYHTYKVQAPAQEDIGNLHITRISVPSHKNKFFDQARAYRMYYKIVLQLTRDRSYDLVLVSSGRFFSSHLGYKIAKNKNIPLYLDIRDIFSDTLKHVIQNKWYQKPLTLFLEYLEKKPFKYASHINLVSEGFKNYFIKYPGSYTYFTNGIDDEFLQSGKLNNCLEKQVLTITYAGNIGDGQGLEKIIPEAAKQLSGKYHFKIIGDGGARPALQKRLDDLKVKNVEILDPVSRSELLKVYEDSDFLFLHLNNYDAFKKVLPSKLFEYAAYPKPLVAGVSGYAEEFINRYVPNTILFAPGDVAGLTQQLGNYIYQSSERTEFIEKFSRRNIVREMAKNIIFYLK
ncbi:MAG: glycosyltransferase family 4 protein [Chitinophagales bacterium]